MRTIAAGNLAVINAASTAISENLVEYTQRLPGKLAVAEPIFSALHSELAKLAKTTSSHPPFSNLAPTG